MSLSCSVRGHSEASVSLTHEFLAVPTIVSNHPLPLPLIVSCALIPGKHRRFDRVRFDILFPVEIACMRQWEEGGDEGERGREILCVCSVTPAKGREKL